MISVMLTLISCSKDNFLTVFRPDEGEIFFGTVGISGVTKAVSESTVSSLQKDGFKAAVVLDREKTLMFNSALTYNAGYYSVQGEKYYYLNTGTISAYAVYPIKEMIEVNSGVASVLYNHDPEEDLIVAKAEGVSKQDDAIGLDFEHALSQIIIKCRGLDPGVDYVLKNIEIIAPESGTYQFGDGKWTNLGAQSSNTYYTGSGGSVPTDSYQQFGESMTFIPGEIKLRVEYDCKNKYDQTVLASYDQTVGVIVKAGERTTLNLMLPNNDVEGFQFSVSVSSWSDKDTELVVMDKSPVFKVNGSGKSIRFAEGFLYWDGTALGIEENIFKFSNTWNDNYLNVFKFGKEVNTSVRTNFNDYTRSVKDVLFAVNGGAVEGYTVLMASEWRYLFNHYLVKNSSDIYEFQVDGRSGIILSVDGADGVKPMDAYTLEEWEEARAGKFFFIPFHNNNDLKIDFWAGDADPDHEEQANEIKITRYGVDYNTYYRSSPHKILLCKIVK